MQINCHTGVKFTSAQLNKFAHIVISLRSLWVSLHALWINLRALWINFCASQYISAQRSKVSVLAKIFPHPQVIFRGALTKLRHIKNNSTLKKVHMWNFYPNGQPYFGCATPINLNNNFRLCSKLAHLFLQSPCAPNHPACWSSPFVWASEFELNISLMQTTLTTTHQVPYDALWAITTITTCFN